MMLIMFFIAYILGSIPFALIVGKLHSKTDVREHGSGNLGATNSARILGLKAGLIVMAGDMSKGVLATFLPLIFQLEVPMIITGMIAIMGHCFPVFADFRGGKAIATSIGVFLVVSPYMALISLMIFIGIVVITKYVSLGSTFWGVILFINSIFTGDSLMMICTGYLSILIIYLHKSNIENLLNKTEPKISFKRV